MNTRLAKIETINKVTAHL